MFSSRAPWASNRTAILIPTRQTQGITMMWYSSAVSALWYGLFGRLQYGLIGINDVVGILWGTLGAQACLGCQFGEKGGSADLRSSQGQLGFPRPVPPAFRRLSEGRPGCPTESGLREIRFICRSVLRGKRF